MIVGMADGFRQQPVFGRDFVERRRHQRFSEQLGAGGDVALHARNHGVEIVEGAKGDLTNRATLRRGWIDVVEILEPLGIFQLAEQRQPVFPDARLSRRLVGKRCCAYCPQRRRSERSGRGAQN